MPNNRILERLTGLQNILSGAYDASGALSASSRGSEREHVVNDYLARVLPSQFRFGSGDATDLSGVKSGQLDIVIENSFLPSLPTIVAGTNRLYLAESIAAVVEVKSNAANQWNEVLSTAKQLLPLKRKFGASMVMGFPPSEDIPLFIVGYKGWQTIETLETKLNDSPNIDGILIIENGLFVSSERFRGIKANGPAGLWGLICCLHQAASTMKAASPDPLEYLL